MDTIKINKNKTLMIAHRGVSGLEKENTMGAFIAAGNRSYFGVETDIHPTKDGVLVIIHDSDTARVAGESVIVEEKTYAELQEITLFDIDNETKHNYLKIPTLDEYLTCCKKYNKVCVIEFKNEFTKEMILKSIELVKKYDYIKNTIFISFYPSNILNAYEYDSSLNLQLLISYEEHYRKALPICAEKGIDFDMDYSFITKEIVDEIHSKGLKLNVWTVNDEDTANRLIEYGVDYITTNILE